MIDPKDQWSIQIDVTNDCRRSCSNCTRLTGHAPVFYMSKGQFAQALDAVAEFPLYPHEGLRLIGMIGGEPLIHPEFPGLLRVMEERIPQKYHRGLWTGVDYHNNRYAVDIHRVFDPKGIHNNRHDLHENYHTPVLVAVEDVVEDKRKRQLLIDKCWLQKMWCSTITPKGYFFCEVAGAMDWVFHGPGGLPVEPGCWRRSLEDFRYQIDRWCQMCGVSLNLKGRLDDQEIDDISQTNLDTLAKSPKIIAGKYQLYTGQPEEECEKPWRYMR